VTAFIDTSVLYALLATDVEEHAAARDTFTDLARTDRLVTHAYVEVETISLVQRRLGMPAIERLVRNILPAIDVETVQPELHRRAREELLRTGSRSVSFVDRVSFAFMREQGIRLALAIDDDFAREGFETAPHTYQARGR
jgi:predicted nucleic acid-binding protein